MESVESLIQDYFYYSVNGINWNSKLKTIYLLFKHSEFFNFLNDLLESFLVTPIMFFNWDKTKLKNELVNQELYFLIYCFNQILQPKNYNDLDFYFKYVNCNIDKLPIEIQERLTNHFYYQNTNNLYAIFSSLDIKDLRYFFRELLNECEREIEQSIINNLNDRDIYFINNKPNEYKNYQLEQLEKMEIPIDLTQQKINNDLDFLNNDYDNEKEILFTKQYKNK